MMAERKRIVVKSTKKSAISKVKVITVESNDVPSLTARHPIGIVVAERRIPSKVSHSEQEPRPVFLPGCPLPQVLPTESQVTSEASDEKDLVTKVYRPKTYRPKNYNFKEKLRKPPKTVTFRIENDYNVDKIYNPKIYSDTSQDSRSVRQEDTPNAGNVTYQRENKTNDTLFTGPPRYVLVSKGVKKEKVPDIGHNWNDISAANNFPVQTSSENSSVQSDSEEFTIMGREDVRINSNSESDSVHSKEDYASRFSTTDTVDSNDNQSVYSEITSSDENQEISRSDSLTKDPPSDDISQVIPVKHGSLRVRQKPHFETVKSIEDQETENQSAVTRSHNDGIRNIFRVKENKMAKQGVTHSGDSLPSTRTAVHHGTTDTLDLGASDIRTGARDRRKQPENKSPQPWRCCSDCSQCLENDQKNVTRQIMKAVGRVKKKKTLKHLHSPPAAITSVRPLQKDSSPSVSSGHPSSRSQSLKTLSISPPRNPVSVSVSSPPRAMSISPPTTLSTMLHVDHPSVPLPGNIGDGAHKTRETSKGTNIKYINSFVDTAEDEVAVGISMEELETVPQWLAYVHDELRRNKCLGDLDAPSHFSSIIQGLSNGTFDEDKYIISQRVDQFVSKACRSAMKEVNEGESKSSPPILPMSSRYPLWPSDPIPQPTTSIRHDQRPEHSLSHPPAQPLSHPTSNAPAHILTKPLPQGPTQQSVHPPPMFMDSQVKREPSSPLGPLQNYIRKSRHHKKHRKVHTNLKEEDSQPKESGGKDIFPAHSHPENCKENSLIGTSELLGLGVKTDETTVDPKINLQISTQASVHIPRENVAESLPGISISPREPPPKQSQQKYKIIEVLHESNHEEPSFSSKNGKAEKNLSDDDTCISEEEQDNEIPGTTEVRKEDIVGDCVAGEENGHCQLQSDYHHKEPVHDAATSIIQGESEEENCTKNHSDDKQQKAKQRGTGKPNLVYLIEYNNKRSDSVRQQDTIGRGYDDDEDSKNVANKSLPGFMPQMRWEEVTIEDERCEENVQYTREMVLEAEERLHIHDLRLRILQRLEERLRELVQVEQTSAAAGPETQRELWSENTQNIDQDTAGDDRDVQNIMAAARAILGSLVSERLNAANTQDKEEDSGAQVNVSGRTSSSPQFPSKQKASISSEGESSSSTHRDHVPESTILQQVKTPFPSPPPEVKSPKRLLTPQVSLEEDTENKEVIATPPSSPPPNSALVTEKPMTPSTTPPSSPIKLKKIVTPEYTPSESPLYSGKTVVHVDTPRHSPISQVADEMVDVPKTPTPSALSPVHPQSNPIPHSVSPQRITSAQDSQERTPPRILNEDTLSDVPDSRLEYGEDMETQVIHKDSRDLSTPETPSVICQSSDVTVSSSVEVPDVTCYTVSEGEIVGGPLSANLSLEAGEIASEGCFHPLT